MTSDISDQAAVAVLLHKTLWHVPRVTSAEGFPVLYQRVRVYARCLASQLQLPLSSSGSSSISGPSPSRESSPPQPELPAAPSPPRRRAAAHLARALSPLVWSLFCRIVIFGDLSRDDASHSEYKHGKNVPGVAPGADNAYSWGGVRRRTCCTFVRHRS